MAGGLGKPLVQARELSKFPPFITMGCFLKLIVSLIMVRSQIAKGNVAVAALIFDILPLLMSLKCMD